MLSVWFVHNKPQPNRKRGNKIKRFDTETEKRKIMNEIIIAKTTSLGTGKLATTTNKIIDLSNKDAQNEKERAKLITNVVNEKMYEKGGFTAASEWAEKFLFMSKSTLSRIVKATNRFSNDENVWKCFTMSQMFEMSGCTDEKLNRLEIKPSMTCKEIRDKIKADDKIISDPNEETPIEETLIDTPNDETHNDETPDEENPFDETTIDRKWKLYKRTNDITEMSATIRHLGTCYVVYYNNEYGIYTECPNV